MGPRQRTCRRSPTRGRSATKAHGTARLQPLSLAMPSDRQLPNQPSSLVASWYRDTASAPFTCKDCVRELSSMIVESEIQLRLSIWRPASLDGAYTCTDLGRRYRTRAIFHRWTNRSFWSRSTFGTPDRMMSWEPRCEKLANASDPICWLASRRNGLHVNEPFPSFNRHSNEASR